MTHPLIVVVGLKREAALVARPSVVTEVGGGDAPALARHLERRAHEGLWRGVVSVGIGGALSPALAVGDWVVADRIVGGGESWATDLPWTRALFAGLVAASSPPLPSGGGIRLGAIAGSDVMLVDARAKAALHASSGALTVDMESHVAARFAAAQGLPFAALRVISDGADQALPPAAQAGMRADGGMDVPAVLRALAKDPRQLPALIRTGLEAEVAFRQLALLNRHDLLGRLGVGDTDLGELALHMV